MINKKLRNPLPPGGSRLKPVLSRLRAGQDGPVAKGGRYLNAKARQHAGISHSGGMWRNYCIIKSTTVAGLAPLNQ
ncbi:hypothetical protein GKQ23_11655 [Erwinia sp. E602]|uniref:hypothetical protein n=1 Tax=Erwinia sp. E602 TaxID=2675378 RepID=UPI001BA84995|nr:hypothetical protein [Erwinia sp. E602]QUG75604.1 hypothetical protein GKQ23_11655 [Erwinia sp. E602]